MEKVKAKIVEKKVIIPFILITTLFALWGFANDITNPLVAAFQTVMGMTTKKASLVQFAFYGGYTTMAIPAALFMKKYTYKKGIILGLALFAIGALLFFPAAQFEIFGFFLVSLYILTFGLAFLETTANPYILSMGDESTATRRLNLAQSFNPVGSLAGMFVASKFILSALNFEKRDKAGELLSSTWNKAEEAMYRTEDNNCQVPIKSSFKDFIGTWQLLSSEYIKPDTIISNVNAGQKMIKMINDTHFGFFTHDLYKGKDTTGVTPATFIAGGGAYKLVNDQYTEYLEFCSDRAWENNEFSFTIEIRGDTLIQIGIEELEDKGLGKENLKLVEKYIRIKK
jgi:hypothetical protein